MDAAKHNRGKLHRKGGQGNNNNRFDNNGYSLIELVIVLAIIAAIMGTVFYSIILIFSANAKSTANDIQRAIGDCKVATMGKASAYMELYRDAGNENVYTRMYVMDSSGAYVPSEPQKVGPRRVTVAYSQDGTSETELAAGDKIAIFFDRANGGFTTGTADDGTTYPIYKAIFVQGGSKHYKIELTKLTGKSEVKVVP